MILYYWKKIKCELCKENYKTEFYYGDKVYNIIDTQKPTTTYVMLEINIKDKNKEKGIYVIELNKKSSIKIVTFIYIYSQGRIAECDIKLNEISVSRAHATISLNPNN